MSRLKVESEIYTETDYQSSKINNGNILSKFTFTIPNDQLEPVEIDQDGDLVINRKKRSTIEIEHHQSTELSLVGLQVWRGALLLADFILYNRQLFKTANILELGSGVGLTGIVAAMYAKNVCCTDINLGGILQIIKNNIKRNRSICYQEPKVMELDFKDTDWSKSLLGVISAVDIILAADVIYDDDLTEAFVETIDHLLTDRSRTIFIALEKRYVFTLADLDTGAPCFEYFLQCIERVRYDKSWLFEYIPLDFPQYFDYDRVKHLVLLKISR